MRRSLIVAFAVVATLLAVSAMPVQAQNASAVASEHTTFGTGGGEADPAVLQNTVVEGSGESATLSFDAAGGTYSVVDDSGDGVAVDADRTVVGDLQDAPLKTEFRIEPTTSGRISNLTFNITETFGSDYGVAADIYIISEAPDGTYGEGTRVRTDWNPNWTTGPQTVTLDETVPVLANETLTIEIVSDSTDSDGVFDAIQVGSDSDVGDETWYRRNSDATASAGGEISVGLQSFQSGQYVSAVHGGVAADHGFTNLTLQNASATVTWQEDADADGTWTNVTSSTYSSTGNVTADLTETTSDRWRVRVDFDTTSGDSVAQLHDEGLLFESAAPTLSDPEPPDEVKIEQAAGNVSINVSDPDVALAQGDNVTVTATDDEGTTFGSTTLTTNGTASLGYSAEAGENIIQWTAEDAYGNSDTFEQTFTTPSTLSIRNESNPDQLVNSNSEITATFFGQSGETVVERTSSDGTFNLSGLPADTEYVVQVDADGYRSRQVIITSLFEQQTVYLLPDSATGANIQFELNDETGRFAADETTLFVKRPITRNGTTDFRTVFADEFGATGALRVTLRDEQRYRLMVRNAEGEMRALSSYTTSGAATAPLTIGQVEVSGEVNDRGVAFDSRIIDTGQGEAIRVVYRDPEQRTDDIEVAVEQNGTQVTQNLSGEAADGRFIATVPVDNDTAENATFDVSYEALRGGETISGSQQVGDVGELEVPVPALPRSLMAWTLTLGVMSLVVIRSPRLAPATGTATASALSVVGWLTVPTAALGIAGAISVLAVLGRGVGQ